MELPRPQWSDFEIERDLSKHIPVTVDCTQDLVAWLAEIEERMWNLDRSAVQHYAAVSDDVDSHGSYMTKVLAEQGLAIHDAKKLVHQLEMRSLSSLQQLSKRQDALSERVTTLSAFSHGLNGRLLSLETASLPTPWLAIISIVINIFVLSYLFFS